MAVEKIDVWEACHRGILLGLLPLEGSMCTEELLDLNRCLAEGLE